MRINNVSLTERDLHAKKPGKVNIARNFVSVYRTTSSDV